MQKALRAGQIVKIAGGKYNGQGAQVRKISADGKSADFLIGGKIVRLKLERVSHE